MRRWPSLSTRHEPRKVFFSSTCPLRCKRRLKTHLKHCLTSDFWYREMRRTGRSNTSGRGLAMCWMGRKFGLSKLRHGYASAPDFNKASLEEAFQISASLAHNMSTMRLYHSHSRSLINAEINAALFEGNVRLAPQKGHARLTDWRKHWRWTRRLLLPLPSA